MIIDYDFPTMEATFMEHKDEVLSLIQKIINRNRKQIIQGHGFIAQLYRLPVKGTNEKFILQFNIKYVGPESFDWLLISMSEVTTDEEYFELSNNFKHVHHHRTHESKVIESN